MRLKKDDVSIKEVLALSKLYYNSAAGDDKKERMKLDLSGARITSIKNFTYDKETSSWKTSEKRHVKFEFIISSQPVSYKKTDTITVHKYPVTIVLYDIEMGMNSPFRFRSGGLKKPVFPPANCSSERRLKITNQNIKNGTDLGFFYNLEWILRANNLLYGPCYATRAPIKTNPKGYVYFDKHTLKAIELIHRIIQNPTAMSKIKKTYSKKEL